MGDTIGGLSDRLGTSPNSQETSVDAEIGSIPDMPAIEEPALGRYGDIPAAYAVFQIDIDEAADKATDARYLYASPEYCRLSRRTTKGLFGTSHIKPDQDVWLAQCYRAVTAGETINGFEYSPLVRSWISFNLAPSDVEGCCVYAFVTVDEQHLDQQMIAADVRTSHIVSEMLSALTGERSHEAAMNGMLEMMATVIQADRLTVFECNGPQTKITFEYCADGTQTLLGTVFDLPRTALTKWFRAVIKDPVALVPNVAVIKGFSPALYEWCMENGIESLMAAPFFNDGEIVGFFGAYNYTIDEAVDLNRLFEAVSSFIGARLDNRRLIEDLDWAGKHDALTGLLNRRGAELLNGARFNERPDEPHAIVVVDLDDFKRINDVYGHAAGDEALRAMAKIMADSLPDDATICRNGGDEFIAMLSGESAKNVDEHAERLGNSDLSYVYDDSRRALSASIGYARYPDHAASLEELEIKADAALYAVKLSGKAGLKRYSTEAETPHRTQLGFAARDIVENVPYPMVVHKADDESAILFASDTFANLLDCDDAYDLIRYSGGTLAGIIHPDDRETACANLIAQAKESGAGAEIGLDFRAVTKSGTVKHAAANSRLVEIADVGAVFYTLVNFDETLERGDGE